ncbi:imidazole glycerol phosphate synthase subunit hisH [Candidatus Nitrososphaera evergladensis SR1]|jgi:glutamine amidotransferase|uniref:Imidazole glycerol phosphate synthase subunit HisH n=1 Tax=Candidatus Nitrososphaera evergladensis SR1 TaxID=1459636 RepID=A0A075MUB1_9ARCH|nr:imidazole glycerol phosphate synthase subunit HisH [Candidatus Nitrososphaera evergladensis]AIF85231.1 imidazole glycerol phosphate synthase subunit hisH [Candidatus Nitrososphaera evergladensis SR1]
MARIAIFDYGAGNLFSLKSALERNGAEKVDIIYDMSDLDRYDGLVLPGVGNFDPAIESIEKGAKRLDSAIEKGKPVMGICLGMEMLFNRSEEGRLEGLKILDGEVVMLPKGKVKVPHMGWNNLKITARGKNSSRFLKGIENDSWVYFVHSYKTVPADKKLVVASSDYGTTVPAVVEKGNLVGVQFHPEKSGDVGAKMIKNFLLMCEQAKAAEDKKSK